MALHLNPLEKALRRRLNARLLTAKGETTDRPPAASKDGPSRQDAQDYVREVQAAIETLAQDIRSQNPRYTGLVPNVKISASRKSGGSAKVIRAVIEEILTPAGARKTQKSIREDVEARLGQPVFKDWTVPLKKWARSRLETQIANAGAPFSAIPVARVRTLSDLWRYAKAAVVSANGETFKLRTTVRISEGQVFIGDSRFKVSVNRSNGYEYKQIRLTVEELLRLVTSA
jgi:hypothetical protein